MTRPTHVQQDTLACLATAESSTRQLTSALAASFDLAVVSVVSSSRTVTSQQHCSLTDLDSFIDSRIRVMSNLATLLSHTPSLSLRPTCARRRRHTVSSTA
jgi:hypothetical protein